MFLKSLYSEPYGLFEPVEFRDGVNFIFGKKEVNTTRDSLNGVGKSSLLELIDFCLCSEFNKTSSSRLFKELKRIEDYFIVLEFDVNGKEYITRRTAKKPRTVEIGNEYDTREYDIKAARKELYEIIFWDPDYSGCQKDTWYRSLLSFYLKIHKKTKNEFIDPIQYLTASNKLYELNQYHLYLMGIDNKTICENFDLQNSVKDRDAALREVKRLIEKNHGVDIEEANKKLDRLQNEIKKSQTLIESFKLADQHKNVEDRLNELTTEIKVLSENNYWDTSKLKSLQDSINLVDVLPESKVRGIQKLYAEINFELSNLVKKSLEDAIEFRKQLSESREEFLHDEIERLSEDISERESKIKVLDEERAKLFSSLRARKAFDDLNQAFLLANELQKEFSDLDSKVGTYQNLVQSKIQWQGDNAQNTLKVSDFLKDSADLVRKFKDIFNYVYDKVYSSSGSSGFNITQSYEKAKSKNKISINISFTSEESKGWNKGRTLIYDLAVVINSIERELKRPRFLVHDGIFDGMDKAHFVDIYHFVQNEQENGRRFQYIITINEEGTLSDDFGATDKLTPTQIASEAIAVLSPKKKLWLK